VSTKEPFQIAGVDGCKAGWFVVVASATKKSSRQNARCGFTIENSFVACSFAEVLSKTSGCGLVCVDIPIGLSDGATPRQCDVAARKLLGWPRAGTIFPPPIRQCLAAKDPHAASDINLRHSGKKLNRQSFFIMNKIRQVDEAMTPQLQRRVREIHPEISFRALNGGKPVQQPKRKLAGRKGRVRLLSPIFPDVQELVAGACKPGEVAAPDILDALAAAWTAAQAIVGRARTLPSEPERDRKGLRMEILYPQHTLV
jgi:predicted RNase H-like nuclease